MSRFGVWIHSGPSAPPRVEAWGELCISTVPDLQACVWFCDLAGLRAVWWIRDLGRSAGTEVDLRESAAIGRIARLVNQVPAARIA